MPQRLRCLLHRSVDHVIDPRNALRKTGRNSVRSAFGRHELCIIRKTRATDRLHNIATDGVHVWAFS